MIFHEVYCPENCATGLKWFEFQILSIESVINPYFVQNCKFWKNHLEGKYKKQQQNVDGNAFSTFCSELNTLSPEFLEKTGCDHHSVLLSDPCFKKTHPLNAQDVWIGAVRQKLNFYVQRKINRWKSKRYVP